MESETGPGEGGITPGSWILVVSPGLHGGGVLGPDSPVGAAEAMQAPGGVPGEEATLYWVEAVEEGAALEEGELSGTGQDVQLLVLDVMEEVEVVVYEEQEQVSSEEQAQELARPGTPSDRPALEALAALQLELEPVNKQAQRAHARLRHKTCQRRTFYLEHRSAIIQGIRGFWVEVVSLGVVLVIFFFFFCNLCYCRSSLQMGELWYKIVFSFLYDGYTLPSCISVPDIKCDVLPVLASTNRYLDVSCRGPGQNCH